MDNKEFGKQLEQRTKIFALSIIRLSISLPTIAEGKVIKNQITKSGTSIGANYREANHSRSKADFLNKIKICESETNEINYWLELVEELKWVESEKIKAIHNEAQELLAILTSIANSSKR
jgi:four helix bundle protein